MARSVRVWQECEGVAGVCGNGRCVRVWQVCEGVAGV